MLQFERLREEKARANGVSFERKKEDGYNKEREA